MLLACKHQMPIAVNQLCSQHLLTSLDSSIASSYMAVRLAGNILRRDTITLLLTRLHAGTNRSKGFAMQGISNTGLERGRLSRFFAPSTRGGQEKIIGRALKASDRNVTGEWKADICDICPRRLCDSFLTPGRALAASGGFPLNYILPYFRQMPQKVMYILLVYYYTSYIAADDTSSCWLEASLPYCSQSFGHHAR
eukprot:scaffold20052_cov21-Prasinocladus_malaysianus.AAC.1